VTATPNETVFGLQINNIEMGGSVSTCEGQ